MYYFIGVPSAHEPLLRRMAVEQGFEVTVLADANDLPSELAADDRMCTTLKGVDALDRALTLRPHASAFETLVLTTLPVTRNEILAPLGNLLVTYLSVRELEEAAND